MYDEKGRVRVQIGFLDIWGVSLYDEQGEPRAWIGLSPSGASIVAVGDENKIRADMIHDPVSDSSQFQVLDDDGRPLFVAP